MKARHLYILPAVVFAIFAGLQYNDLDYWYWMAIYGFVALSNVLALFNKLNYIVIGVGFMALLFFITAAFQAVEVWSFDSEEGREIFGLIIACNWMGFLGIVKLYNESK